MAEHRALESPRMVQANSSICQTYVFIYARTHTHLTYRTTRHPLWSLPVNMDVRRRGRKISTAENRAIQMFQRLQMFHKPKKTACVWKRISSRLFLIQREEHFWFKRSLQAFLRSLTKRAKQQPSGSGLRKRFQVEECRDQFLLTMWQPGPEKAWKGAW